MRRVLALVTLLPLAGCLDSVAPGGAGAAYYLGGTFTEDASDADLADFRARMAPYGDVRVMESFPMQFAVDGLTLDTCREARVVAEGRPYVADVRACHAVTSGDGGPDAPTSSG